MGFMDYQRPMQVEVPNFYQDYMNAKNLKQQGELNNLRLQQAKGQLEREEKGNALASAYAGAKDETAMTNDEKNAWLNASEEDRKNIKGSKTITADEQRSDILKQWAVVDPQGMAQTVKAFDALDESKQKAAVQKASKLYSHISSVMNPDGSLNQQAYNMRAPAYGLPQIDGQKVTADMIMGELKQAEMQVVGIQEYAKNQMTTKNELLKEDRKYKNKLGEMNVEYGYRQGLQASGNAHDMAMEDKRQGNRVALKQIKGANEDGIDAQTREKISFAKTKINSLTQQLNASFDKEERKQIQTQINAHTKKVNDLLGDNEEDSTMPKSGKSWDYYLKLEE